MSKRKIAKLVPTVFIVGFFLTNIVIASDDESEFKAKLTSLLQESKKSQKACDDYTESLSKLTGVKDKNSIHEPNFKDRSTALAAMEKLTLQPETPESTRKAIELILKKPKPSLETDWLGKTLIDVKGDCAYIEVYLNLKHLIENRIAFKFTKSEQKKMRDLVFEFIRKSSANPRLISSILAIELIERLNKSGMVEKSERFSEKIATLKEEAQASKKKLSEKHFTESMTDKEISKTLLFELFETAELQSKIQALAESIEKASHSYK